MSSAEAMEAAYSTKARQREIDPHFVIEDMIQQIILIFERAPQTDVMSSMRAERAFSMEVAAMQKASEDAAEAKGMQPPPPTTTFRNERLSIAQRALRLLTTCAALGNDDSWGSRLAQRALDALLELLESSEESNVLIISEALAVLQPPVLSSQCHDVR